MARTYRTIPTLREQDITRFWSKVDKRPGQGPKGECWEWQAGLFPDGYGCFAVSHRQSFRAHRIAFFLQSERDPSEYFVCHTCDNPICCNIAHLFEGTPDDNTQDAKKKGRLAIGDKNGARLHPERLARGERNGRYLHPENYATGDSHWTRKYPEKLKRGSQNWKHQHPESSQGENNGRAVLKETQVKKMRELFDSGEVTNCAELGRMFGVSRGHARKIVRFRNTTWVHL